MTGCSKEETHSSGQGELDSLKNEVLEENRVILSKYLKAERHFIFLRSMHVLSKDDCDELESVKIDSQRANKMLDILMSKGPTGFDSLCQSLIKEKTQIHLLRLLNTNLEQKRQQHKLYGNALLVEEEEKHDHKLFLKESDLPGPPT